MTKEVTFNKSVFIPQALLEQLPAGSVPLDWSHHALQELADDGFDFAPETVSFSSPTVEVVEVSAKPRKGDNKLRLTKVVARVQTDGPDDMVLVLIPDAFRPWEVRTAWANDRHDQHSTLRTDRVAMAPVLV